jgi:hypothetical protein
MNAYLVSHNGLGDHLFMIGALRFLLTFYNKIYFLCVHSWYHEVKLFFDNSNIICVTYDGNNEYNEIANIILSNYDTNDILVCGTHKSYLTSKITHPELINFKPIDKGYTIDYDTFTSKLYNNFIENFYKDINLNLTYFYDYFYISSTTISLEYYNYVKDYYIVFIQTLSSDGKKLNIDSLLEKYLHNKDIILISSSENLYDIENKTKEIEKKYDICNKIRSNNRIIYYNDIILNSDEIYIINSCFLGIILPYLKTNKLKTNKVRIIYRELVNNIVI